MFGVCCSLLVRSGLILAGAALARHLMRRSTAAERHRILIAAFSLLLLWPLLSAMLPELPVSLPLHATEVGTVTVQQSFSSFLQGDLTRHSGVPWPLIFWVCGVVLVLIPVANGYRRIGQIARSRDIAGRRTMAERASGGMLALTAAAHAFIDDVFGSRNTFYFWSSTAAYSASRRLPAVDSAAAPSRAAARTGTHSTA